MGQQQLILMILVTIIVGIATIVAIDNMRRSYDTAAYEAIQQDILQAQSHSIAYVKKPLIMGGGGGSYVGITLEDLQLPEQNDNAIYQLDNISPESFTIVAQSAYGLSITAVLTGEQIEWERSELE